MRLRVRLRVRARAAWALPDVTYSLAHLLTYYPPRTDLADGLSSLVLFLTLSCSPPVTWGGRGAGEGRGEGEGWGGWPVLTMTMLTEGEG